MAHHYHRHRRLPRNPDFWDDVGSKLANLNPFAPDNDNGGNGGNFEIRQDNGDGAPTTQRANTRQARSTVVKTIYQTVTDGDPRLAPSPSSPPILAQPPIPTQATSPSSDLAETTIARAGAPLVVTPDISSTTPTAADADTATLLPSVIDDPLTLSGSIPTTLAIATDTPTLVRPATSAATVIGGGAIYSSSPTPTSAAAEKPASAETSGAAKAGIAIGVLAGVLVVFLLVFFLFNRRKKQLQQQRLADEDEKSDGFGTAAAVTSQNPYAPRISLRPVTEFSPTLNMDNASKGPAANMNANLAPAAAALGIRNPNQSAWERPTTSQSANPANPFGAQAERINGPIPEESVCSLDLNEKPLPSVADASPASAAIGIAVGAAAAGPSAGNLTRKTSIRKDGPKALDLTLPGPITPLSLIPASPAGTTYSRDSAGPGYQSTPSTGSAAIAAAGGPVNTTVHRVQLEFKPTLEDEMELRAGQLVRLLHEYDDGWALCIRLDRSQQGVVPRTCLSARPVKPRPPQAQGPPRGHPTGPGAPRGPGPNAPPGQRPFTPQGGPHGGRPASPSGHGPMGPGGRPQSPGPRYQGPPGQRPQSPNEMGGRNQSPGPSRIPQPTRITPNSPQSNPGPAQGRPGPPVGSVGRKPVPGQAV
ncbi:variant SH3 domain-containing protein [Colletotrichum graminicola]|uniref:Variant SH3 domain-containing protein n=1 Tax=Colletotrichum graminicola (strain M1.001 / M2 / FGSC 10212) TaxID=645133 RepID=E3QMK4_COLGM|nr:variant SH3 domain-containing protein [Colletotrichum graminicola M1.001]EFQ32092.1 variant SH3 domain-containing protein [Colletotrichum graminicola M1.001]WDK17018.1 variant SH3 domain-containing protein [Colletotrichum graminicola]